MAMTLAQGSAVVALGSAVVAVVVTILGVFERERAFRAQQAELNRQAERWNAEFLAQRNREEVLLRKEFLLEQYRYRLAVYRDVLKTLGAVPDMMVESGSDKYKALHGKKELLRSTSDALRGHLYGEAGLLMTMPTRNALHSAWRECLLFLNGDGDDLSGDLLIDVFFHARRYLRADLELLDDRTPENLESLVRKLDSSEGSVP
jgi:hypothetical protein